MIDPQAMLPELEARNLPYHHPDLPADLASELPEILNAHGLGVMSPEPRATYQSLPSSPPTRRAGLEDIFLFSRDAGASVSAGPAMGDDLFDGLIVVTLPISIQAPVWFGDLDTTAGEERIRASVQQVMDELNGRWAARGSTTHSAPGAGPEYTRCLIHFRASLSIAGFEAANGPFAGPLIPEFSDAGAVACVIQLSRAAVPRTCWKSDVGQATLGSGSAFELDVPASARSKVTIQNLKSRIDQYHACDGLQLSERLARIREIRTGARAFLELESEIGEDWAQHTALAHGEYPEEKRDIEEAIRVCREARDGELSERLERLEQLRARCTQYRASDVLKRGWRASPFTVEIDAALVAYEDLPPASWRERIDALEMLQSRCAEFTGRVRQRNRFWHRHLHRLAPEVEALARRARKTQGEVALFHGITRLIEAIDVKADELGVLRATRALAARANLVKVELEAQLNSVVLLVEYGDDDDPAEALGHALRAQLPALFGVEQSVNALQCEDIVPLVRRVLPLDSAVTSLA